MIYPIYLDYNATTPCEPRVIEKMLPYFGVDFGNASSKAHAFGWMAEEAVDLARQQICWEESQQKLFLHQVLLNLVISPSGDLSKKISTRAIIS
jgi:hypothetical protein